MYRPHQKVPIYSAIGSNSCWRDHYNDSHKRDLHPLGNIVWDMRVTNPSPVGVKLLIGKKINTL